MASEPFSEWFHPFKGDGKKPEQQHWYGAARFVFENEVLSHSRKEGERRTLAAVFKTVTEGQNLYGDTVDPNDHKFKKRAKKHFPAIKGNWKYALSYVMIITTVYGRLPGRSA